MKLILLLEIKNFNWKKFTFTLLNYIYNISHVHLFYLDVLK